MMNERSRKLNTAIAVVVFAICCTIAIAIVQSDSDRF